MGTIAEVFQKIHVLISHEKIRIDPDKAVQQEHMIKYIVFEATEWVVIMPFMVHVQSLCHIFKEY